MKNRLTLMKRLLGFGMVGTISTIDFEFIHMVQKSRSDCHQKRLKSQKVSGPQEKKEEIDVYAYFELG